MTIFCDLDGVLADFTTRAADLFGADKHVACALMLNGSTLHDALGVPKGKFWGKIGKQGVDFWSGMDWTRDGRAIWGGLQSLGPVEILSSPSPREDCRTGKLAWVSWQIGDVPVTLRKDKHALAGVGRVLVDDTDKKIDAWRDAGGVGVLVPRPWNSGRGRWVELNGDVVGLVLDKVAGAIG